MELLPVVVSLFINVFLFFNKGNINITDFSQLALIAITTFHNTSLFFLSKLKALLIMLLQQVPNNSRSSQSNRLPLSILFKQQVLYGSEDTIKEQGSMYLILTQQLMLSPFGLKSPPKDSIVLNLILSIANSTTLNSSFKNLISLLPLLIKKNELILTPFSIQMYIWIVSLKV